MKPTDVKIGDFVEYENEIYKIKSISNEYPILDTIKFGVGVVGWEDIRLVKRTIK